MINGKVAKAGSEVKVGDIICIRFGMSEITVRVLLLTESSKKEDAVNMYEII